MDLTDEDWESGEAKALAAALIVAAALALIVADIVAATFAFFAATVVVALDLNSKLIRFPGAYLHYRRRIKHD
jgi:hypothetical protein